MAHRWRWRLLKTYEGRLVREFDAVLAVSYEDKIALQEAAGESVDITVIPIAVDTGEVTVIEREAEPRHILHIGTMYWPPNIYGVLWFAHEVYPLIRRQRPDVCFDIVGARPPREIVVLSGDNTGINVTGYVKDSTPYLERAGLMVVPLRAGGDAGQDPQRTGPRVACCFNGAGSGRDCYCTGTRFTDCEYSRDIR